MSTFLSSLAVAALSFTLTAGQMHSGADLTTRRVGDAIQYTAGCHAVEDMTRLAESGDYRGLGGALLRAEKCFHMSMPAAAVLKKWVSGPYTAGVARATSIWKVVDQFGETEFILLFNLGGPHEAQRDAS